jgi:hypothetical protein
MLGSGFQKGLQIVQFSAYAQIILLASLRPGRGVFAALIAFRAGT